MGRNMPAPNRVPKLRALLKKLGACAEARRWSRDMTLSQAWERKDVGQEKEWLLRKVGLLPGLFMCTEPGCAVCAGPKETIATLRRELGITGSRTYRAVPRKMPAALAHFDGYEPVERAAKRPAKRAK